MECVFCHRTFNKKFGLRNHLRSCPEAPKSADLDQAYHAGLRNGKEKKEVIPRTVNTTREEPRPRKNQSELAEILGAFTVLADHIPLLLDINFAITLADHILEHGSDNRAIMAFAHQLKRLDE